MPIYKVKFKNFKDVVKLRNLNKNHKLQHMSLYNSSAHEDGGEAEISCSDKRILQSFLDANFGWNALIINESINKSINKNKSNMRPTLKLHKLLLEAVGDDYMEDEIMNPETKNKIKIKGALSYDPSHPVYKAAQAYIQSRTQNNG